MSQGVGWVSSGNSGGGGGGGEEAGLPWSLQQGGPGSTGTVQPSETRVKPTLQNENVFALFQVTSPCQFITATIEKEHNIHGLKLFPNVGDESHKIRNHTVHSETSEVRGDASVLEMANTRLFFIGVH